MSRVVKKLLMGAVLAWGAFSFPAKAGYAHVQAGGTGPTYNAAVSYAVGTLRVNCARLRGNLISYYVPFSHENAFGWNVTVAGTCFILP